MKSVRKTAKPAMTVEQAVAHWSKKLDRLSKRDDQRSKPASEETNPESLTERLRKARDLIAELEAPTLPTGLPKSAKLLAEHADNLAAIATSAAAALHRGVKQQPETFRPLLAKRQFWPVNFPSHRELRDQMMAELDELGLGQHAEICVVFPKGGKRYSFETPGNFVANYIRQDIRFELRMAEIERRPTRLSDLGEFNRANADKWSCEIANRAWEDVNQPASEKGASKFHRLLHRLLKQAQAAAQDKQTPVSVRRRFDGLIRDAVLLLVPRGDK
jgi:hypothetical protein